MKIGFYAPGDYADPTINYSGPSLGLGYISSLLQAQFGSELEAVFLEIEPELLIEKKPDIVGISAFTYAYGQAVSGAEKLRQALGPDVPIIVGGPHISALPQNLQPSMTVGVLGEGERVMADLVQLYLKGDLNPEQLKNIDSIVYWDEAQNLQRSTGIRRIHDLDALPLPDRQLMRAYWPEKSKELVWMPTLSTARGCPFTCGFCMYSETANLVRYHSAERVMADLEDILRQFPDISHIRITDDLFVTKKARLRELAEFIRGEGYHKRVTFGCMAKASFFDEEYCEILKSMNIAVMSFGFESASDPVLHYLKDRKSSSAKNFEALRLCHKHGIHVGGYFIIGAPPETPVDLAKTYWFISQNNPIMPVAGIFPLIATPGTAVWNESHARGLIDANYDNWKSFTYQSLETKDYLHLNPNYTFEEFYQYHQKSFRPIKLRSSFHLTFMSIYRVLLMHYYQYQVYPQLLQNLPIGSRILEIGRGDLPFQHLLESDFQLKTIYWKDASQLDFSGIDVILLSHSLEKFGFNSPQWQAISAFEGPIILLVENAATWAQMIALLNGWGPHGKSVEQFFSYFKFALKNLKQTLTKQGYQIQEIQRHRTVTADSEFFQRLVKPFQPLMITDETDFFSYPLLTHIMKSFAGPDLIQFLQQHLPIQDFVQDAEVFSYTLFLQREPSNPS